MKRWSVRRVLVGLVAVAISAGARQADAQTLQTVVAGAPVMVRAPIPDEQPVIYPQPYVQPVVYPQPYVQPLVVYPEPVFRPVRVNPYSQPVVYPTPQPVALPVQPVQVVQPVQPLHVHVNVSLQANPVPVVIAE